MNRIKLLIAALLASAAVSYAQDTTAVKYSDIYLDTVKVTRKYVINDYNLIGFHAGVSINKMTFNPTMKQESVINPETFGITFTHFCKMFGIWPYFGFTAGINYSHEGYAFKADKETGKISSVEGYSRVKMSVVEIPVLTHVHFDMGPVKIMGNIGLYGGYRTSIERTLPQASADPSMARSFTDYDRRFDYGLQGGGGLGFMIDPIEIHFNGMVRYSWGEIWEPDYASPYYYRYAYPFDIMITAGICYQITKRHGKTSGQLKKEARTLVYGSEAASRKGGPAPMKK